MNLAHGTDRCRCSLGGGCGEYFNSTHAFELHRVAGHCLTVKQMRSRGMEISNAGYWVSRKDATGARAARRHAAITPLPATTLRGTVK
jgi:hypothetical protein